MDVGHIEPAAIGDGNGEVAELQRCAGDIALPHAYPPDGLTIPPVLIAAVQIIGTCQESALLTLYIYMHRTAKSHGLHIGAPGGNRLIARLIHEIVVDHRGEGHQEPCVAALCQRIPECQRRTVLVTAHLDIAVGNTIDTLDGGLGRDDALGEQRQCLGGLEGRARGIGFADGLTHIETLRRVGGQTEDLAVGGVDGHDAARFSLQQLHTQLLKGRAQCQRAVNRQFLGINRKTHKG